MKVDERWMTEWNGCKCCFWSEGRSERMEVDEKYLRWMRKWVKERNGCELFWGSRKKREGMKVDDKRMVEVDDKVEE